MSMTRAQFRQKLGLDTAGEKFISATIVSTAAADTFVLAELKDAGADAARYRDSYVLHGPSGESRRIVSVDKAAGQATVHRAFTALSPAQAVEVHRFDPVLLHQAINDGLARCARVALEFPAYVNNSGIVDLSSFTYILSQKDILGVYIGDDSAVANAQGPEELVWARRFEDGFLYLDPAPFVPAGQKLWLRTRKPYDPLTSDASTTDIPELYGRAAARVALYKLLLQRPGPGKEKGQHQQDYVRALADFRHYAKIYAPHEGRKIQPPTPDSWGPQYPRTY